MSWIPLVNKKGLQVWVGNAQIAYPCEIDDKDFKTIRIVTHSKLEGGDGTVSKAAYKMLLVHQGKHLEKKFEVQAHNDITGNFGTFTLEQIFKEGLLRTEGPYGAYYVLRLPTGPKPFLEPTRFDEYFTDDGIVQMAQFFRSEGYVSITLENSIGEKVGPLEL